MALRGTLSAVSANTSSTAGRKRKMNSYELKSMANRVCRSRHGIIEPRSRRFIEGQLQREAHARRQRRRVDRECVGTALDLTLFDRLPGGGADLRTRPIDP